MSFCDEGVMRKNSRQHILFTECTVFLPLKNTLGFCLPSLGTTGVIGIDAAAPVARSTRSLIGTVLTVTTPLPTMHFSAAPICKSQQLLRQNAVHV